MLSYRVIGRNIKAARDRLGMTQEQIAQRLDMTVYHYGRLERGVVRPNLERLEQICEILSIPIESVFSGASSRTDYANQPDGAENEIERKIAHLLHGCDEAHKQAIFQMCETIAKLGG